MAAGSFIFALLEWGLAVAITIAVFAAIVIMALQALDAGESLERAMRLNGRFWAWVWRVVVYPLQWPRRKAKGVPVIKRGQLPFGRSVVTGDHVALYPSQHGHIGIFGQTGNGKSYFIRFLLYTILSLYADVSEFIFIDPKGVDFRLYRRLTQTIFYDDSPKASVNALQHVKEIIEERKKGMQRAMDITGQQIDDIDKYHEVLQSGRLEGQGFTPYKRVYFVADEIAQFSSNAKIMQLFREIIAVARYANVTMILLTQHNNAKVLDTQTQGQLKVKFMGYMGNGRSNYQIGSTKLPDDVDLSPLLVDRAGRFMMLYRGNADFIQVPQYSERKAEALIKRLSLDKPETAVQPLMATWADRLAACTGRGSKTARESLLAEYFAQFEDKQPETAVVMADLEVIERTAQRYSKRYYQRT